MPALKMRGSAPHTVLDRVPRGSLESSCKRTSHNPLQNKEIEMAKPKKTPKSKKPVKKGKGKKAY